MGPRKLLLWDIDGTLMLGDRAGERALVVAMRNVFGVEGNLATVEVAGRTDRLIADDLLRAHGIEPTPKTIHDFLEGYVAALPLELGRGRPRLLPGILQILATVAARPDLAQGLLTGNLSRGAHVKLSHFDVWRYFPFGAFAEDAVQRNELGPHALRRAGAHHATEFDPHHTFIIGDTPHDVACGQAVGAATIAVATGRYTMQELAACGPTLALPDLNDVAGFMAFIDAHPPVTTA